MADRSGVDRPTTGGPTADRAVSEGIGYVIVFGVVVTTVALVVAAGTPALSAVRDYEQANNAERAFDVLDDNVEDVVLRGAPSRSTEIKLADATLRTGEPVVVNVTGEHSTDPSRDFAVEYELVPIVYESGTGGRIVFVGGATLRESPDGSHVREGPPLITGPDRVVLPIVQTRTRSQRSIGGSRVVQVRTDRAETERLASSRNGTLDLTLNVTSPRAAAWERHLDARDGVSCHRPAPSTVSCDMPDVERAFVTVVRIDVTFE